MQVRIRDQDALLAVSPTALSAYARAAGWEWHERYRVHSDVYVGDDLPEIIVPRTGDLGDYASAVAELIKIFAHVEHQDETSVYRSLVTADRDVVRLRTGDSQDGSVALSEGVDLIKGARDMLLAAACTLDGEPKSVYRAGANRSAIDLLASVRLGQTDQGSFVVTLLTPVVPPSVAPMLFSDEPDPNMPIGRRLTTRLMEALTAVRRAMEQKASGNENAFTEAVVSGVSANLCEALARIIDCSPTLDVNVSWARTQPVTKPQPTVPFDGADGPPLREAARMFREHAPQHDVRLRGYVQSLKRGEGEEDGTISLNTSVNEKRQTVTVFLERQDYERVVQAHRDQEIVILSGDLERKGERWQLINPHLEQVSPNEEGDPDE